MCTREIAVQVEILVRPQREDTCPRGELLAGQRLLDLVEERFGFESMKLVAQDEGPCQTQIWTSAHHLRWERIQPPFQPRIFSATTGRVSHLLDQLSGLLPVLSTEGLLDGLGQVPLALKPGYCPPTQFRLESGVERAQAMV